MKKYFYPTLFLVVSAINIISLASLHVNGQDINDHIKPGQIVTYQLGSTPDVMLRLRNGQLHIKDFELKNIQEIEKYFNTLEENKESLVNILCKRYNAKAGSSILYEGLYVNTDENIFLNAGSKLKLHSAILKSKEVVFECNALDISSCFIDADTLQIKVSNPESIFKFIRFTFNKNSLTPKMIEGKFDFSLNETDENFFILGAEKIDFLFSDKAFVK